MKVPIRQIIMEVVSADQIVGISWRPSQKDLLKALMWGMVDRQEPSMIFSWRMFLWKAFLGELVFNSPTVAWLLAPAFPWKDPMICCQWLWAYWHTVVAIKNMLIFLTVKNGYYFSKDFYWIFIRCQTQCPSITQSTFMLSLSLLKALSTFSSHALSRGDSYRLMLSIPYSLITPKF